MSTDAAVATTTTTTTTAAHLSSRSQQHILASQHARQEQRLQDQQLQQQQQQQQQQPPPPPPPQKRQAAMAPTAPEGKPPKARPFGWFPLGYRDAVYQWWTSVTPSVAERNVLNHIQYIKQATAESANPTHDGASQIDPYGTRIWHSTMVQLSGKNRALNEFSVERVGEEVDNTLVMLHGYGAGLGFFYQNFEGLTRSEGWRLYALDMLGMGNSSRPPFKIHAKDQKGKIGEAESWFIDALEEWRRLRKIESFTLLGHSLGGYLAVSYALKYPGRINKLILASPVGIPEDPYAVNAAMPEPDESSLQQEFSEDQESTAAPAGANAPTRSRPDGGAGNNGSQARRPMPGWLVWLWDANVSPFSIVRLSGPFGPRFVSGWTSRRFNHLPAGEAEALHAYAYNLFRQKGSGEYALTYLLAPGAYARSPVINRVDGLGRQPLAPATEHAPAPREAGFPVVLMYGENDWMDVAGGFAAEERIKQRAARARAEAATDDERRRENGDARVVIVSRAGHHLYLDNADEFNEIMRRELEETAEHGRRMKALS